MLLKTLKNRILRRFLAGLAVALMLYGVMSPVFVYAADPFPYDKFEYWGLGSGGSKPGVTWYWDLTAGEYFIDADELYPDEDMDGYSKIKKYYRENHILIKSKGEYKGFQRTPDYRELYLQSVYFTIKEPEGYQDYDKYDEYNGKRTEIEKDVVVYSNKAENGASGSVSIYSDPNGIYGGGGLAATAAWSYGCGTDISISNKGEDVDYWINNTRKKMEYFKKNENGVDDPYIEKEIPGGMLFIGHKKDILNSAHKFSEYHEWKYHAVYKPEGTEHIIADVEFSEHYSLDGNGDGIEKYINKYSGFIDELLGRNYGMQITDPASLIIEWQEPVIDPMFYEGQGSAEKEKKEDVVVESTASKESGEQDGGIIDSDIVEGNKKDLAGVAGGVAAGVAAVAGLVSNNESADEDKKKKYRMVIYKDFGDIIRRGEKKAVYACIMEQVGTQPERVNIQLTSQISIFSKDGIFFVQEADALSGDYKAAWASVSEGAADSVSEGVICFRFDGAGGSYTNEMKFNITEAKIIFHQENIALEALDRETVYIPFTVLGLDPDKMEVDVDMEGESSYKAEKTNNRQGVKGTYFAALTDINELAGDAGTYTTETLTVRAKASNSEEVISAQLPVYRVTTGLNIATDRLDVYRVVKKESLNKDVKDLTEADFDSSVTKVNVMVLRYDKEEHRMWHEPAFPELSFYPEESDREDNVMQERLDALQLTATLTGGDEGMAEYTFYSKTGGYLSAPLRPTVMMKAVATVGEERYEWEDRILLQSQPLRDRPSMTNQDVETQEMILELQSMIMDNMDDVFLYQDDELNREYQLLGLIYKGYEEYYGFDLVQIEEIKYRIYSRIARIHREYLDRRQAMYLTAQTNAYEDAGFLSNVVKSLAMSGEDVNQFFESKLGKTGGMWGQIAVRVLAGLATGGGSEIPYMAVDTAASLNSYHERVPFTERTTGKWIWAGVKPLAMAKLAELGVGTLASITSEITPEFIKSGIKEYGKKAVSAGLKKVPVNVINVSTKMYKSVKLGVDKINSIRFDPKKLCFKFQDVAVKAEAGVVNAAGREARELLMKVNKGARTETGKFMSLAQEVAELEATLDIKEFEAAYKAFKADPNGTTMKTVLDSEKKIMGNVVTLNKLNQLGSSEFALMENVKNINPTRKAFNSIKMEIDDVAEGIIKKKAALLEGCSPDDISFIKKTGNAMDDIAKGRVSPRDTDISVVMKTKNGNMRYISEANANEAVYTGYCDTLNIKYSSVEEAKIAAEKGLNINSVAQGSGEYIHGYKNLGTRGGFTKEAIELNRKTYAHKFVNKYKTSKATIDKIVESDIKKTVEAELEAYKEALHTGKKVTLSSEARESVEAIKGIQDSMNQVEKTAGHYKLQDIQAQANGFDRAYTANDDLFVEATRMTKYEGIQFADSGQFHDMMALKGKDYLSMADEFIDNTAKTAENAIGINPDSYDKLTGTVKEIFTGSISNRLTMEAPE